MFTSCMYMCSRLKHAAANPQFLLAAKEPACRMTIYIYIYIYTHTWLRILDQEMFGFPLVQRSSPLEY